MRLSLCSSCERHVDPGVNRCPFCSTRLGTTTALHVASRWLMVAGLAMVGCTEKSTGTDDPSCEAEGGDTCTADSGDTTTQDNDSGGEDYAGGGEYEDSDSGTSTGTLDYGGEDYAGSSEYDDYGDTDDEGDTGTGTGDTGTGSGDSGTDTDTDTDTTESS